jgi:Uma2 family endonuclease
MTQSVIRNGEVVTPEPLPRMTYEEFLEWCDEGTHAEWVDGKVVWMSPVSKLHDDLAVWLLRVVGGFVEVHQLGAVQHEPFQMKTAPHLPGRAPDLLFVANEHLSRFRPVFLEGPADLAVEIVSPDDPDRDRVDKYGEYEQGGVREYWLLDQPIQEAKFYLIGEDGKYHPMPVDDDGVFHSVVLPGFWLKIEWIWQEPRPAVLSILREWGVI